MVCVSVCVERIIADSYVSSNTSPDRLDTFVYVYVCVRVCRQTDRQVGCSLLV